MPIVAVLHILIGAIVETGMHGTGDHHVVKPSKLDRLWPLWSIPILLCGFTSIASH